MSPCWRTASTSSTCFRPVGTSRTSRPPVHDCATTAWWSGISIPALVADQAHAAVARLRPQLRPVVVVRPGAGDDAGEQVEVHPAHQGAVALGQVVEGAVAQDDLA